ncbi:MAG TPA: TonB family protein [Allosphingosinicella sp.]|jgi:TonB family protein
MRRPPAQLRIRLLVLLPFLVSPAAAQVSEPTVSVGLADYPDGVGPREEGWASLHVVRRGPAGEVVDCNTVESSGEPRLDGAACRILLERARLPGPLFSSGRIAFRWHSGSTLSRPVPPGGPLQFHYPGWFTNDDYPLEAIRLRQGGIVEYSVQVSAEGRPTSCSVVVSSNSPALDLRTCEIVMRRAIFIPASDGRGGRAAGTYLGRINWRG